MSRQRRQVLSLLPPSLPHFKGQTPDPVLLHPHVRGRPASDREGQAAPSYWRKGEETQSQKVSGCLDAL